MNLCSLQGTRLFIKNLDFKPFFNVSCETFILIYTNNFGIMLFISAPSIVISQDNLKMIVPKSSQFIHIRYV